MRGPQRHWRVRSLATVALPLVAAALSATVAAPPADVPGASPDAVRRPVAATARTMASAAPTRTGYLHPTKLYYGVSTPGLPGDTRLVRAFAARAHKAPNLVLSFQSWSENFDVRALRHLSRSGRLPVVAWEPWNYRTPTANPYPLKAIAAGTYDRYLRKQARLVKSAKVVVGIRLAHEMNGDWYPWGQGVNHNAYSDYVRMYRHVHDVFRRAGVRNVLWTWSPNVVDPRPKVSIRRLYPGDSYVDWVGLVGYLPNADPYYTYANVYQRTLAKLDTFARTKPILITETSVERGANRPAKIRDLLRGIATTPRLIGFVWFEHEDRRDWRLAGDPAGIAAFRAGIASPRYGHG
jgi:hypothetical protein